MLAGVGGGEGIVGRQLATASLEDIWTVPVKPGITLP